MQSDRNTIPWLITGQELPERNKNPILVSVIMKNKKKNTTPPSSQAKNPFVRILQDKKRIQEAVCKGVPLSSLKDIKFVKPI